MNKLILYIFLVILFNCNETPARSEIAIINVNIIPMDSERILESQTLIIEHGIITKIGSSATVKIPKNAQIINGKNRYLIPGLMDMHVHIEESDLPLFLANGITTVRNLNGDKTHLKLRRKVDQGEIAGPRIYTSGPLICGKNTKWKIKAVPKSQKEVKEIVKTQKKLGYDFIKVYDGLTSDIYQALMEEAKEQNIKVVGHIPKSVGLKGVLNAGQASIEHIEKIVKDYFGIQYNLQNIMKVAKMIKSSGTFVCPTLALQENFYLNSQGKFLKKLKNPEMNYVDSEIMSWWKSITIENNGDVSKSKSTSNEDLGFYNFQLKLTKSLFDMKIPLIAGTDTPNLGMVPGFSIHEELRNMVAAGLSPYHALETATRNAAAFLGIENETGIIKEGMIADLVLLKKNPLINISNTKSQVGIIVRGKWYSKNKIQASINKIFKESLSKAD